MMPVTTVDAAVRALQALMLAGVTGLREAPSVLTETPNVFPCSRCYPWEGEFTRLNSATRHNMQTIALDVHVARRDLRHDMTTLAPLLDAIGGVLVNNPTISGTVDTIEYPVRWSLKAWSWDAQGAVRTFGFAFLIQVKMQAAL